MRRWSRAHTTHRTCASSSRRQKYQCPLRCALKSVTSPRTHSGRNAPSSTSLTVCVSDATLTALEALLPGVSSPASQDGMGGAERSGVGTNSSESCDGCNVASRTRPRAVREAGVEARREAPSCFVEPSPLREAEASRFEPPDDPAVSRPEAADEPKSGDSKSESVWSSAPLRAGRPERLTPRGSAPLHEGCARRHARYCGAAAQWSWGRHRQAPE